MTKPRVLVLSTSTNDCAKYYDSLHGIADYSVFPYDRKWHDVATQLIADDPQNLQRIQTGQLRIRRDDCAMDREMLLEARISEPDFIVYISAWTGDFVPLNETLGEINQIAPLVHLLCDGADPPWWPQLQEFERRGTFSLTVNIDGSHRWPGGRDWATTTEAIGLIPRSQGDFVVSNALTLLTPIDTRPFAQPTWSFKERPYAIGYAGNKTGAFRDSIVNRLNGVRGFAFKDRDPHPNSYPVFADFLKQCRISVSVPFTGSGTAKHVKGRVLETGFAGACLLEWRNDATASWFTPYADFWPYDSVDECAEYAEWLAHHPTVSGDIARSLSNRMWREHSPAVFWGKVLERVGK